MGETVVGWVEEMIQSFGYLGVVVLMVAENLFPPIPSEVTLPLTGFLVGRGDLKFVPALLAATLGSLLGALVLYSLGRWGGRPLILRYAAVLRLKESDLDRADAWFDRYGSWVVLFGRMLPFVRSVVSVPAGMSEMPILRFSLLTSAGSAAWNTALMSAGWFLGENWSRVSGMVGSISNAVLIAAGVAAAILAIRWGFGRFRRREL